MSCVGTRLDLSEHSQEFPGPLQLRQLAHILGSGPTWALRARVVSLLGLVGVTNSPPKLLLGFTSFALRLVY